ncbi:MAG: hypothetical protein RLZZ232_2542, partial [Planctomycetota bacterium]
GRFTDVTRAQTPIHCDQPVLTQGLKDLRSHMTSRCDSETSYCRVTSDWHPRLSHAVASRLYNSHSACRLNCEAMPCNSLGHQSEVRSNGNVGVAKQRLTCPPWCDHRKSDHSFKHVQRDIRAGRLVSPRWGFAQLTRCIPRVDRPWRHPVAAPRLNRKTWGLRAG